jgi:hypothetical protein
MKDNLFLFTIYVLGRGHRFHFGRDSGRRRRSRSRGEGRSGRHIR